jgi:type I restriction enzyme S subunit
MTFRTEPLGALISLRKGLSYKGEFLVEESSLGLLGLDAFLAGGGYKAGAEKPYSGPFKSEHLAGAGDVLLAMTEQQDGLLASPLLVPEDLGGYDRLVFSHHVAKVLAKSKHLRPEFVYNFLRVPINRTRAAYGNTGTTVQDLPYEVIYEQKIPLPSPLEQDRINSVISLFDRRIQLCLDMAENLGQLAICSYGAELERIAKEQDVTEILRLGDICKNVRNSVSVSSISESDNYIGLDLMPRATPVLSKWTSTTDIASNKSAFSEDDILFGKLRPYFQKAGVALTSGICSTDILVLQPKENLWFSAVLSTVSDKKFVDQLTQSSSGTRMPRTSWNDMAEYELQVPDTNRNIELSAFGRGCFAKIKALIILSRTLRDIQATVLPELLSGKMRLADESMVL